LELQVSGFRFQNATAAHWRNPRADGPPFFTQHRSITMNRGLIAGIVLGAALLSIGARAANAQGQAPAGVTQAQLDSAKVAADDVRKQTVAANMILTDSEAKAFWPVYEKYRAEMAAIRMKGVKALHQLATSSDSLTDANVNFITNLWLSNRMAELKLRQAYFPKFSRVLPPKKVARYFQIEHRLDLLVQMALAQEIPLIY
jgi:hypothetical protein